MQCTILLGKFFFEQSKNDSSFKRYTLATTKRKVSAHVFILVAHLLRLILLVLRNMACSLVSLRLEISN
jgi:hypothetical protein